jgi:hypothetical protein
MRSTPTGAVSSREPRRQRQVEDDRRRCRQRRRRTTSLPPALAGDAQSTADLLTDAIYAAPAIDVATLHSSQPLGSDVSLRVQLHIGDQRRRRAPRQHQFLELSRRR